MAVLRSFEELRVYREAFDLAIALYEATNAWPREEQYSLTDQIRRSSRSVCANIAEAWFKRRYPRSFVSKLSDAGAEASETLVWIDFATAHSYLTAEEAAALRRRYDSVLGGLVRMMEHPDQWVAPNAVVREPEHPYAEAYIDGSNA